MISLSTRIYQTIIVAMGVLLGGLLLFTCGSNSEHESNIKALQDTIRTHKLSNGQLLSETRILKAEKGDLLKHLEMTKKEYKEIEKHVGKIRYITKIESHVITDTLMTAVHDTIIDSIHYKDFKYDDGWISLHGRVSDSIKFKLQVNTPLTVGYSKDKFFITSPNPYVNINSIKGGTTKSHWGVGLYGGFGVTYGLNGFDVGPQIGLGIIYKF